MEASKKKDSKKPRRGAPGKTVEERENQLIALAIDVAEKQLEEGTASAQVITHFLKLGSTQSRLDSERTRRENELLKAKTDAIAAQRKTEKLYASALRAMSKYSGKSEEIMIDDE